ncbi:MAG: hypothetical protein OXL37_04385 [Chloroflexota bacterium]|nr:hypothetical protein [Chloroflexota bacterium]MDE2960948.1 hypothetical protein [Chloroflexota bacterium]
MQGMDFDRVAPGEFGQRPGQFLWEDGHLMLFDNRDKHEWETMALEAFNSYYDESDNDPEYQAWLASLPDIREQRD